MESQIDRIRAESDLREIGLGIAIHGKDAIEEQVKKLTTELGEKYQITRPSVVKSSEEDRAKMRALAGNLNG